MVTERAGAGAQTRRELNRAPHELDRLGNRIGQVLAQSQKRRDRRRKGAARPVGGGGFDP